MPKKLRIEDIAKDDGSLSPLAFAQLEHAAALPSIERWRGTACTYCGDFAGTVDHLLPRSWTGEAERPLVPVVPACQDCNSALGDALVHGIQARAAHVAKVLRRKNHRLLDESARWSDAEMAELDGVLSIYVTTRQTRRRRLWDRLAVLEAGGVPSFGGEPLVDRGTRGSQ